MRLARRDPELYGGYKVATATLILAIAAGVFSVVYVAKNIPQFLENRRERRLAATHAAMYHLANLLETYKRTYGSYPRNTQEIKKAITESLPMDYWKKSIQYQSFTDAIAEATDRNSAGPESLLTISNCVQRGRMEKKGPTTT